MGYTLKAELNAIRQAVRQEAGLADLQHLAKMERWTRSCGLVGLATAWIIPNPFSALLISQYKTGSWTMMAHHILHRGYDHIPGVARRHTSQQFARGWRRWIDWPDWIWPPAWSHEHNHLHHYHLGEHTDPDLVERNLEWLRQKSWPAPVKVFLIALMAMTWKFIYYAGNTLNAWYRKQHPQEQVPTYGSFAFWNPLSKTGRLLWGKCFLPYVLIHFMLIPGLFLLISEQAALFVLINILGAEMLTNLHSFAVIVTNHTGDDVYRFDTPLQDKEQFYFRQIAGSVNFNTGSNLNDFLHGYLNYQIEHHLWPDLTMLQYRKAQPLVKALAKRHGIPYVQQSVWVRIRKTVSVMAGLRTMPVYPANTAGKAAAIPAPI